MNITALPTISMGFRPTESMIALQESASADCAHITFDKTHHSWQSADKENNTGNTRSEKSGRASCKTKILKNVADVVQDSVNATPPIQALSAVSLTD